MTLFITADPHFGHTNILKYCNRPYPSIWDMDEAIILHWNNDVGEKDEIYCLGDFCFGDPMKYFTRLSGIIHIVPGSHDKVLLHKEFAYWLCPPLFTIAPKGLTDEYGRQRTITLCHYSMRSWPRSHYASWHLWGHSHGKLKPYGLSFDVGVDSHDFRPWSLEEIQKKMKTLQPIVDLRK